MDAGLLTELSKYGLLGILFALALLALRSRDASYREVQEKRIDENKTNTERFLTATNANTDATDAAAEGFKALAKSVEDLSRKVDQLAQVIANNRGGRR